MLSAEVRQAINEVSNSNGLDPVKVAAVIEVESAGLPFWTINGKQVPPILTEAHYFYRLTKGATRAKAVAAGLANPKWKGIPYPRTNADTWSRYERMRDIDPVAAMGSCSWGLAQVMGDKWAALGYSTPEAFIEAQMTIEGQLDAFVREVVHNNLVGALGSAGFTADSWRAFAKGYNGSGYDTHNYHGRIAAAYNKYSTSTFGKIEADPGVKLIQQDLIDIGAWKGPVDGFDNAALHSAIKDFQSKAGINADGLYGPITARTLAEAKLKASKSGADSNMRAGAIATAAVAIGEKAITQLTPLQSMPIKTIQIIATVGIIAAVCLIAYGMYRRAQLMVEVSK